MVLVGVILCLWLPEESPFTALLSYVLLPCNPHPVQRTVESLDLRVGLNQPFAGQIGPRIGWLGCFDPRPYAPTCLACLYFGDVLDW